MGSLRWIVAYIVAIAIVIAIPTISGTAIVFSRQADEMRRIERKSVGLEETVRLDALLQRLRTLRRYTVRQGAGPLDERLAVESAFTRVRDYALGPAHILDLDDPLGRLTGIWRGVPERGQGLREIDRTIAAALDFSRLVEQRSSLQSDIGRGTSTLVDAFAVQIPIIEDRVDQEEKLLLAAYRERRTLGGVALGINIFSAQADRAYRSAASDAQSLSAGNVTSDDVRRSVAEIGRRLDEFRARARSASAGSFRGRRDARPFVTAGDALAASIDRGNTSLVRAIRTDFERTLVIRSAFIERLRLGATLVIFGVIVLGILVGRALQERRRRETVFLESERARRDAEDANVRAREQLALTEARFEAVFARTSLGIAIVDLSGTVVRRNETLAAIFPSDDVDFVDRSGENFSHLIAGDLGSYCFERAHAGLERQRWTEADVSSVRDNAGEVLFAVAIVKDITERHEAAERLRYEARFDALVDLPNRAHLIERVTRALGENDAVGVGGLAFVALDEFRAVVDSLGQHVGDRLLVDVADRLRVCVDGEDFAARMNGSDFAVFFARRRTRAEIVESVERIVRALDRPYALDDRDMVLRPRIGLVPMERTYVSVEELVVDADTATAAARLAESTRYALFEPAMRDRAARRVVVLANLQRALERDQLHLYYQPIVGLEDRRVGAYEVLVRWDHPELGSVSPAEFIPLAEETGLIRPIGRWVFERACAQLREWRIASGRAAPNYLTVNVSVGELMHGDYSRDVEATLARHGLHGNDIVFEITESVVLATESEAHRNIERLRAVGVRFSIDDFGTGFSSLRYLQAFAFDFLKIDQGFVRGNGDGLASESIVAMIVALGASIGVAVVAEGVETALQAEHLRALGMRFAQGYYFGRATPASAVRIVDIERRTMASRR